MRQPYTLLLIFLASGILLVGATSADDMIGSLINKLQNHHQKYPQEKVFVHFNKSSYSSGETVWYKIYQTDANSLQPTSLSTVVYLDFYSPEKDLIIKRRVETSEGLGYGSFDLPPRLSTGEYTVKAYTNWMLNFDLAFLFTDHLTIYGAESSNKEYGQRDSTNVALQFFPEGGYCTAGLPCRVGVKTSNSYRGTSRLTKILDDKGGEIASLITNQYGIGSFYFVPQPGQKYYGVIGSDSAEKRFDLPRIKPRGFAMQVNSLKDRFQVIIHGSSHHHSERIVLALVNRGEVRYSASGKLYNNSLVIDLPKAEIPSGVSYITLFNKNGLPELERLVYISNDDVPIVSLEGLQERYRTRNKVKFDISINLPQKENVRSYASITVISSENLSEGNFRGIRPYLLLSSDLSRPTEDIDHYLNSDDGELKTALDNFLLTHGWRRYSWRDIMEEKDPDINYLVERGGFAISGVLTDSLSGQPIVGSQIFASSENLPSFFEYTVTDKLGNFNFFQWDYYGEQSIIFSINDTVSYHQPSNLTLYSSQEVVKNSLWERETLLLPKAFGEEVEVLNQIGEIYNPYIFGQEGNRRFLKTIPSNPDTSFLIPDRMIRMTDYVELPNMREVIRELLHGVRVRDRNGLKELRIMVYVHNDLDDSDVLRYYDEGPLVLINRMPIFNMDTLLGINPNSIDSVAIVYGKQRRVAEKILDKTTFDGVLQIFLNEQEEMEYISRKRLEQVISGFEQYKEFYSPSYGSEYDARIPDFRSNLYWNPDLRLDKDTVMTVEFYTSDIQSDYNLILQGITDNGEPFNKIYHFSVE